MLGCGPLQSHDVQYVLHSKRSLLRPDPASLQNQTKYLSKNLHAKKVKQICIIGSRASLLIGYVGGYFSWHEERRDGVQLEQGDS